MAKDIQGIGLRIASRFAGSEWAQKHGLQKPAERLAYLGTKKGFEIAGKLMEKRQKNQKDVKLLTDQSSKPLFDLSLSEEQQMIQDSIRAYASEVVRGLAHDADENKQLPENFLEDISALGLNLFSVPESMGGAATSYSPTTSAIIAEELARGDFTLAYATLAPVAVANALVRWGTEAQKNQWLPRWAEEKPVRATIAVQENHPLFDANKLGTKASKSGNGYVLNGIKTLVPFGGKVDLYLVAASLRGKPRLFIVPGNTPGLKFKAAPAMGVRAAETGTLTLDGVKVGADALLGGSDSKTNKFNYQEFIALGQLHWCALAIGTGQAALDYSINYANERIAFGEPISHRQSVAFMISNMAIEIDAMRLMVWRAAALAEKGQAFQREAYLAQILCQDKAMEIGTNAVQILGGHGFTKEHPAERWYRDLRILACVTSGLHL